jgi:hypothetical protein
MKTAIDDTSILTRYLLGELPEEEKQQVEQRFLCDGDYYEQLLAVEDELRYDCAEGRLTAEQRAHFQANFLATADDMAKMEFATSLISELGVSRQNRVKDGARFQIAPGEITAKSIGLRTRGRFVRPALAAAAVILATGCALILIQSMRLRRELERSRQELATERLRQAAPGADQAQIESLTRSLEEERTRRLQLQQDLERNQSATDKTRVDKTPQEPPQVASFLLLPGLTREAGAELKRIELQTGDHLLRLQLKLREPGSYTTFQVRLKTPEGRLVWSRVALRPVATGSGPVVAVTLPVSSLLPGDYDIELSGLTQGSPAEGPESVDDYYFTIVKR